MNFPMRKRILLSLAALLAGAAATAAPPATAAPVAIIFDTDMGNDIDDALALAMIHALERRGACRLLAVTLTNPDPLAGAYVDAINTFHGRADIPIGISPHAPRVGQSKFLRVANAPDDSGRQVYPWDFDVQSALSSVELLRRTLAAAADSSVVLVQVGFFTNLAALLETTGDATSPLSGRELVARKVRLLSLMGGAFQTANFDNRYAEFNVRVAVVPAQRVASDWPTPIVWSGWEIGVASPFPATAIDHGYAHAPRDPVREGYQLYNPTPHERPTWDLSSVLHAVYPEHGYFALSTGGRVTVEDDGFTRFKPAQTGGRDRFLTATPEQAARVRGVYEMLCTERVPPRARTP